MTRFTQNVIIYTSKAKVWYEEAMVQLEDKFMASKSEGAEIVFQLLSPPYELSVWEIAKRCDVSYQTGKAWKRGWWNPDMTHTYRLMAILTQERQKRM